MPSHSLVFTAQAQEAKCAELPLKHRSDARAPSLLVFMNPLQSSCFKMHHCEIFFLLLCRPYVLHFPQNSLSGLELIYEHCHDVTISKVPAMKMQFEYDRWIDCECLCTGEVSATADRRLKKCKSLLVCLSMDIWVKTGRQSLSFFTAIDAVMRWSSRHTGNVNSSALRSGAFRGLIGSFHR